VRFEGKTLFVTGGGSGIAAAVSRRFAAEGGRVAVLDFDGDRARSVAEELDGAIGIEADVADEKAVCDAVSEVHERFGRIDCLYTAAGHFDAGPIEEWDLERWNRMMAVHAGGTFLVCRHVVPLMRDQGSGSIVNTASTASFIAQTNIAGYGAAKGAILSFSRQLALEAGPEIRVNAIVPGPVRTALTAPLYAARGSGDYKKGEEMSAQSTILKRVASPEEIAAPICFLLSDEASIITGTSIVADGGQIAF
jgi:NAD(P)-dependent dehydrogenase (short-subunit alcohol dehydrogenase family)